MYSFCAVACASLVGLRKRTIASCLTLHDLSRLNYFCSMQPCVHALRLKQQKRRRSPASPSLCTATLRALHFNHPQNGVMICYFFLTTSCSFLRNLGEIETFNSLGHGGLEGWLHPKAALVASIGPLDTPHRVMRGPPSQPPVSQPRPKR